MNHLGRGRDPNFPAVIFNGYLGPANATGELSLYSDDGVDGRRFTPRSDGAQIVEDEMADRSTVRMS